MNGMNYGIFFLIYDGQDTYLIKRNCGEQELIVLPLKYPTAKILAPLHSSMFIAALFTVAHEWTNPRSLSTDWWMGHGNVVYVHNVIFQL